MTALQEYYSQICKQLNEGAAARDTDIARMLEEPWSMLRDHKIRVRQARFVLEYADMEAARLHTLPMLAVSPLAPVIIKQSVA